MNFTTIVRDYIHLHIKAECYSNLVKEREEPANTSAITLYSDLENNVVECSQSLFNQ